MTPVTASGERSLGDWIETAAARLAEGDSEAAVAALIAAAKIDNKDLSLQFVTALTAWQMGDLARALELAKGCYEQAPMNGSVAELLASVFAQVGELLESLYYGKLSTALERDPRLNPLVPPSFPAFETAFLTIQEKPLYAQAQLLLASGKVAESLDKARQHVEIAPGDMTARLFYAECLLRHGEASDAARTLSAEEAQLPAAGKSLLGRALARLGMVAEARRLHDQACRLAPQDLQIGAARLADAPWLALDEDTVARLTDEWAKRHLKTAKRGGLIAPRDKLVIGYLVSAYRDRRDIGAIAAVARGHDRSGAVVIGYGTGARGWPENAPLGGAFDEWRDISGLDAPTLARTLASDRVHVVVDVAGLAAPKHLQALARLSTALRVAWLAQPTGLGGIVYDAVIAGPANLRPTDASPPAWPVGWGGYPLVRDRSRPIRRVGAAAFRFGADVSLAQLDAETVALWSAILDAVPEANLLLYDNDLRCPANVARLIERFGSARASRIDVVTGALEEFYAQVDLALAPLRGTSPRMAAEAIACEVPPLAMAASPYGTLLADLALDPLIAATAEDYRRRAETLARSAAEREAALAAVRAPARGGERSAAAIAADIERATRASTSEEAA